MPAALIKRLPLLSMALESVKLPLQTACEVTDLNLRWANLGFNAVRETGTLAFDMMARWLSLMPQGPGLGGFAAGWGLDFGRIVATAHRHSRRPLERRLARWRGQLALIDAFRRDLPTQGFVEAGNPDRVLLDLPGLRLHDLSLDQGHRIANYTVVFAPRAGHHSNIAERAALFLRDQGLTRLALVEQKCADDIPLYHQGRRHREDFAGQVDQYAEVLAHLKRLTGKPPHAVAICQPGPLLMATVILHPDLAHSFGSAGSPMNTAPGTGFLSDWARLAGPAALEALLAVFGRKVEPGRVGQGRPLYDGTGQVLGFYWLGLAQHAGNFKRLVADSEKGDQVAAKRQLAFYRWYNTVYHHPEGFIRDTFTQVFARNALMRGSMRIGSQTVSVKDFPPSLPVWALAGSRDDIAPAAQALGHMELLPAGPAAERLSLLCDAGHMGLFRSQRILNDYYSRIAAFLLARSDPA